MDSLLVRKIERKPLFSESVIAKPTIKPLLEFIKKRESIRLLRRAGAPPPWTTDHILQTYRFCNVRRKHDRVTQWLRANILNQCPPYGKHMPHFLALVTLSRFVNWPPTLMELREQKLLKEPLDWNKIGKALEKRHARDEKTWTGAYMIKGHPDGKGKYIARVLGKGFKKHGDHLAETLRMKSCKLMHMALQDLDECGRFLAGQVVADLTYTPLLEDATDLYTWAPLGPGSRRGYNRLLGKPIRLWPSEEDFVKQLIVWRQEIIKRLGSDYEDLTLHDVQSLCCEIDKYLRVKTGEGRPRSTYIPEWRF